ncbi:MAG: hypothetical protein ACI37R_01595 [Candidatus Avigastranaerophilus sp.]
MYNSIYPGYGNYYSGLNNRQITRKKDDEKNSHQSQSAQNAEQEGRRVPQNTQLQQTSQNSTSVFQTQIQQNNIVFPNGEKSAIDYTKKHINITQVVKDFKNTANAIGAPDDIKAEVQSYLSLVESQSQKESPNQQIIQSNLKNASQILDAYITDTLKKPSTVVENWVDALFLQQIDYKAPNQAPKEALQTDFVAAEEIPSSSDISAEEQTAEKKNDFYIPGDKQLKNMFIRAKKYAAVDNKEKALHAFQQVADYAEETGDIQTAAIAYYEQGLIYDDFNRTEDALYNLDRASKQSDDNNIKARAHLSMGKIYDDYVNFEPAVDHYCAAVSFAGESDNLNLQTKALSDLTKIHAARYDKENTFMFMDMTDTIAEETRSGKIKGITFASNADCCEKLNEKARALEYYGKSAQLYTQEGYYEGLAKDYSKAADIMVQYGNAAKAKKLLSKAYIAIQKCDNPELKQEIVDKITSL